MLLLMTLVVLAVTIREAQGKNTGNLSAIHYQDYDFDLPKTVKCM